MMKTLLVGLGLVAVSVFGLSNGLAAADGKIFDASQTIASDAVPSIFEELQGIRRLSCQNQCTRHVLEMRESDCDSLLSEIERLACKTVRDAFLAYLSFGGDYETCMNRCMRDSEGYGSDHGSGYGDDDDIPPPPPEKEEKD